MAFHAIAIAEADSNFAKKQLLLLFGQNYIAADGQLPAYEWNFSDVNPPVQALACTGNLQDRKKSFWKNGYRFFTNHFSIAVEKL
ncbi:MAG: hypothetical protein WDM90_05720 [Ferruginibacter sp.]